MALSQTDAEPEIPGAVAKHDLAVGDNHLGVFADDDQFARSQGVPVTFDGGPLHGLRITVMQHEATGAYFVFCMVTEQGPVQSTYMKTDRV